MAGGGPLIGQGPILGLISGLSWGAGDFCGGLISRFSSTFTSVFVSQVVGLASALVLLSVVGEAAPSSESVMFAVAAGFVGVIGLACFYYALGRGTMGVIAPLAALIGAGVPVLLAIYNGEEASHARLAGIGLALLAVVLISLPGGETSNAERRRIRIDFVDLPLVILAGLGFAGFFVFIQHAAAAGEVFWPLAIVRSVGVTMVAIGFVLGLWRARQLPGRERVTNLLGVPKLRTWPSNRVTLLIALALTGLGDLGGNVFFVLAQHADLFSVAVVLSSLYPVITTILAVVVLHERLRRLQMAGVALATLSVVLLSNAVSF